MSTEESSPSDDEDKYLEESPCGRWHRRNTKLKDVPGIDALYQAMDMEEGVEVVWNEMAIACVPLDDECLDKLNEKLMKLAKIEHPNLLKLYASWFDKPQNKMVFITEYYSAGSIRRFIQRRGNHPLNSKHVSTRVWKRWAKQILSALSCLHSPEVAITHGYVTCDTIFIQHDGYIKLGSVAPSMIQDHISSCSRTHRQRHRHYCAPEYGHTVSYTRSRTHPLPGEKVQKMVHRRSSSVDGKKTFGADKVKQIQRPFTVDIYAFGIFCLEILSDLGYRRCFLPFRVIPESGYQGPQSRPSKYRRASLQLPSENPDLVNDSEQAGTQVISLDDVKAAIGTLDAEHQVLILSCIDPDQTRRPSANTLISMSVFYEIPSLKVMCVHVLRQTFDHLDVRHLQDKAREEQHYIVGDEEEVSATPQHLEIEKIDTEIKNGMHLLSDTVALRKLSPVKNKSPVEGEESVVVREDEREHKGPSVESRLMIDSDDSFHTSDNSSIKTTSIIITSPSLPFTTSQPSSSFIPDVLNSMSQTSSEMLPSTPSTKSSLLSDSGKESSHQCSVIIGSAHSFHTTHGSDHSHHSHHSASSLRRIKSNPTVSNNSLTDEPYECRLILCIKCQLNPSTVSGYLHLTLEFQMSDTMIRTLDTDIHEDENPEQLVDEIIGYGLLNKLDREMVVDSLVECLT